MSIRSFFLLCVPYLGQKDDKDDRYIYDEETLPFI